MRIIAIVNVKTGALCIQEMLDQGNEVVAVVCDPRDPRPTVPEDWSVKRVADRNYLPVYQPVPKEINSPAFVDAMRKLNADLIVAMHYGVIFKPPLLGVASIGAVNMHPTRLPCGQGKTPACWHMLMGDDRNWMTLHWLDPGIDTGDIIDQISVEITPEETGHDSSLKLFDAGHKMFAKNLPLIREGKASHIPQNQINGVKQSYYRWEAHNSRISWDRSASEVALHIRTLDHPKWFSDYTSEAYSYLGGYRIKIWKCKVIDEIPTFAKNATSGEILAIMGEGVLVKAETGGVLLTDVDVEWDGSKGMEGFLRLIQSKFPSILD